MEIASNFSRPESQEPPSPRRIREYQPPRKGLTRHVLNSIEDENPSIYSPSISSVAVSQTVNQHSFELTTYQHQDTRSDHSPPLIPGETDSLPSSSFEPSSNRHRTGPSITTITEEPNTPPMASYRPETSEFYRHNDPNDFLKSQTEFQVDIGDLEGGDASGVSLSPLVDEYRRRDDIIAFLSESGAIRCVRQSSGDHTNATIKRTTSPTVDSRGGQSNDDDSRFSHRRYSPSSFMEPIHLEGGCNGDTLASSIIRRTEEEDDDRSDGTSVRNLHNFIQKRTERGSSADSRIPKTVKDCNYKKLRTELFNEGYELLISERCIGSSSLDHAQDYMTRCRATLLKSALYGHYKAAYHYGSLLLAEGGRLFILLRELDPMFGSLHVAPQFSIDAWHLCHRRQFLEYLKVTYERASRFLLQAKLGPTDENPDRLTDIYIEQADRCHSEVLQVLELINEDIRVQSTSNGHQRDLLLSPIDRMTSEDLSSSTLATISPSTSRQHSEAKGFASVLATLWPKKVLPTSMTDSIDQHSQSDALCRRGANPSKAPTKSLLRTLTGSWKKFSFSAVYAGSDKTDPRDDRILTQDKNHDNSQANQKRFLNGGGVCDDTRSNLSQRRRSSLEETPMAGMYEIMHFNSEEAYTIFEGSCNASSVQSYDYIPSFGMNHTSNIIQKIEELRSRKRIRRHSCSAIKVRDHLHSEDSDFSEGEED